MGINRGKQFEQELENQFALINNISFDRIYDITMGYKDINNPCDFILYKYPNILYLECKTKHGNTLNFKSDIRENQWNKLYEHSKVKGVNAGIICWFIDSDITVYLPIQYLHKLSKLDKKSFNVVENIKDKEVVIVEGTKRRILFDYSLEKFMEEIKYDY